MPHSLANLKKLKVIALPADIKFAIQFLNTPYINQYRTIIYNATLQKNESAITLNWHTRFFTIKLMLCWILNYVFRLKNLGKHKFYKT